MPSQPIQLVGGFYADDDRPWSSQDVCNWIPVSAEAQGTRSPAMWRTPPGLKPYVQITNDLSDSGPIRGMRNVEGKLLVVAGSQLYQISNTGIAIPRGTIPGVGPVQMSHNQQGAANEVIIVNGSAGYIYNTSTLALTRITDAGYPGAKSVTYLASYFLQVEPAGRFWFHSDLADGLAYNTLDRYESEAKPDRLVCVVASSLEAVAFNETTIEFFVNTGAATGTFQSKGIVIETGCAGRNCVVELDNSLLWLDNKGVFQRMDGYSARPISTRVLERAIAQYDWANAISFVWEDRGHKVAYWTFPDGFTVGYDVTTGLWHRRATFGMNRWRLSSLVKWNGRWIGGDYQTGRLYELDWDYMLDGSDPIVRRAVTGVIHNDQRRFSVPSAELVFDTGGPATVAIPFPEQPTGPTITGDAPDGTILTAYSYAYTLTEGSSPIVSCTIVSGSIPLVTAIDVDGVLSGTLTDAIALYTFRVRVTDANGLWDEVDDTINVTLGGALTIPVLTVFLDALGGSGAADLAAAYTDDNFSDITITTEPWAKMIGVTYATGGDIQPEMRNIVYDEISQGGAIFYDSGWRGDVAHQAAVTAALAVAGLTAYDGTIVAATPTTFGGNPAFIVFSDAFELPVNFDEYSSRSVYYHIDSSFNTALYLQYPDPAEIPVGATKVMSHPGYYVAGSQLYVCDWEDPAPI